MILDGGNLLFSQIALPDNEVPIRKNAAAIAAVYSHLKVFAVNVGQYDLSEGIEFLQQLPPLNWTSASFYSEKEAPIFAPYRILHIGSYTVAVTGLSEAPVLDIPGVRHLHWRKALLSVADSFDENIDFIILLSAMSPEKHKEIIKSFPQIRLIISSNAKTTDIPPQLTDNTLFIQNADRGRTLGALTLVSPDNPFGDLKIQDSLQNYTLRLDALQKQIGRIDLQRDREKHTRLTAKVEQTKVRITNLKRKLDASRGQVSATYQSDFLPITSDIVNDPEAVRIIKKQLSTLSTN